MGRRRAAVDRLAGRWEAAVLVVRSSEIGRGQPFATLALLVATGALGGVNHRGATSIYAARLGILRSPTFREEAP
jgi:hypothetical protein